MRICSGSECYGGARPKVSGRRMKEEKTLRRRERFDFIWRVAVLGETVRQEQSEVESELFFSEYWQDQAGPVSLSGGGGGGWRRQNLHRTFLQEEASSGQLEDKDRVLVT